jgi:putative endonuclease
VFRKEWGFDSLHGHQPSLLRSYGWQASLGHDGEAAKAARRSPKGEDGLGTMKYVHLLQSIDFPDQTYVGLTDDLRIRFSEHNRGRSPHTAKYRPWHLLSYVALSDERKAIEFERYLKSASGRAFANKRLR